MARRGRPGRGRLVFWIAAFLVLKWALSTASVQQREVRSDDDQPTRPLPRPPDSTGTFTVEHRWDESELVRGAARLRDMELEEDLEYRRLSFMSDRFGVPERWFETVYQASQTPEVSPAEVHRLLGELIRGAGRRGVIVRIDGDAWHVEPDYRWIIDKSRKDVAGIARRIQRILREKNRKGQRDLHRIAASFVQTIEYTIPEPVRLSAEGDSVMTLGIATPIEVLHNRWGDCDSKSLLFAAILENYADERVIFLRGNDHLFVGVRGIPRRGDHYVRVQGVYYVLIEMTNPWPLGVLPRPLWRGVNRDEYAVITP